MSRRGRNGAHRARYLSHAVLAAVLEQAREDGLTQAEVLSALARVLGRLVGVSAHQGHRPLAPPADAISRQVTRVARAEVAGRWWTAQ